ncbi:MAG: SagB/ThcOx family dehydrogenase [Planctomycetaceae bacterium]|jgi:nitroreductase|nr:SagB/ThcOx family dehydrogenase [Planctomycetaceae bacterium]
MSKIFIVTAIILALTATTYAADITLPPPQKAGGKPIFDVINERQSSRSFDETALDYQTLSDLLWAGFGYNREGKRTAPSPLNLQETEIYVILKEGVYLYDAKNNKLLEKNKGDFRQDATTGQDYVKTAPVNLIFVVDKSKNSGDGAYFSVGAISENIYLVAASKGLGAVVRTSINKNALKKSLKLNANQEPVAGQTIGKKKL